MPAQLAAYDCMACCFARDMMQREKHAERKRDTPFHPFLPSIDPFFAHGFCNNASTPSIAPRPSQGQKSQYCSAHKREGQVDVCNRRCQQPNCSKRPCFGFPGQRPTFCGSHRSTEMVDVISHKCSYPGCSHPTGHEGNRVRSKFCGEFGC